MKRNLDVQENVITFAIYVTFAMYVTGDVEWQIRFTGLELGKYTFCCCWHIPGYEIITSKYNSLGKVCKANSMQILSIIWLVEDLDLGIHK